MIESDTESRTGKQKMMSQERETEDGESDKDSRRGRQKVMSRRQRTGQGDRR